MAKGKSEKQLFGGNAWEIVGEAAVRNKLKKLGDKIRRSILVQAMQESMAPMLPAAKREVAVATGELRGALVETTLGSGKGRILVDVLVRKVGHAGFSEFGTKRFEGNRDMLRVWDAHSARAAQTVVMKILAMVEHEAAK